MTAPSTVEEILDYAIAREQEAHDGYMDLAKSVTRPWMREVFEGFAKEEAGHKKKLLAIKDGKLMAGSATKVVDLKIGDYLVEIDKSADLNYQQALILAMKKEKAAFKMYSDLAARITDPGVQSVFLMLAQEEAKHKLRFEIEYDDFILTEN
jgi:rubrerythrin